MPNSAVPRSKTPHREFGWMVWLYRMCDRHDFGAERIAKATLNALRALIASLQSERPKRGEIQIQNPLARPPMNSFSISMSWNAWFLIPANRYKAFTWAWASWCNITNYGWCNLGSCPIIT